MHANKPANAHVCEVAFEWYRTNKALSRKRKNQTLICLANSQEDYLLGLREDVVCCNRLDVF